MQIDLSPTQIDGEAYYTVKQFSWLTAKTSQTIYFLYTKGNARRKLKVLKVGPSCFIPVSELTDFPFMVAGRPGDNSEYHYDEKGNIKE